MRAQQLAINGHARNLADGTVEVLACGSPEALAALETFLRRGPSLARVAAVAVSEANAQPPFGCRIS